MPSQRLKVRRVFSNRSLVPAARCRFPGPILWCALLISAGCASAPPRLVLDPIGPVAGGRPDFLGLASGYLKVFTATRPVDSGGIIYQPHTSYSVYSPDGKRLKGVVNHVGDDDNNPMTVPIPPGSYFIYAQSDRFGQVKVPVLVVGNKTTIVYLEGAGMPHTEELAESQLVRLPDGRVAGRRAEDPRTRQASPGGKSEP